MSPESAAQLAGLDGRLGAGAAWHRKGVSQRLLAVLGTLALALAACATGVERLVPRRLAVESQATRSLHGLLLLLEDERIWEPAAMERALADPELRLHAVRALARIRAPEGLRYLQELVDDPDPEVVREATEALRSLSAPTPLEEAARLAALRRAAAGPDLQASQDALLGLAEAGWPLERLEDIVGELAPVERVRRMASALGRVPPVEWWPGVEIVWDELDDSERAAFAAQLARGATREMARSSHALEARALEWLRQPALRGAAAMLLGEIGAPPTCRTLRDAALGGSGAAEPAAPLARAALLRGLERCLARGALAAGSDAKEVVALLEHSHPAVRVAAASLGSHWAYVPQVVRALTAAARDEAAGAAEREAAVVALARARSARAPDVLSELSTRAEVVSRWVAARALRWWPSEVLEERLLGDRRAEVRSATLDALAQRRVVLASLVAPALQDDSPWVRAAALDLFARHPVLAPARLLESVAGPAGGGAPPRAARHPVVRLSLLDALVARARHVAADRADVLETLEGAARSEVVREVRDRAAWLLAQQSGGRYPGPARAGEPSQRAPGYYEAALDVASRTLVLEWDTSEGRFDLELDCEGQVLLCRSLRQLAEQGFFADSRVGPGTAGETVRVGDPTGTGRGGPGYWVRDVADLEAERQPPRPGTVWLERRWPDTGASRLRIELTAQRVERTSAVPIGRVADGLAVLERLQTGDHIVAVRARDPD